eukprot:8435801-Pyramimonas_sp.AAC.1
MLSSAVLCCAVREGEGEGGDVRRGCGAAGKETQTPRNMWGTMILTSSGIPVYPPVGFLDHLGGLLGLLGPTWSSL